MAAVNYNESDCFVLNVSTYSHSMVSDYFLYKKVEEVIFKIVLPIVIAFGFFGNACFLFVIWRVPRTRTVTNMYLSHLSVADMLFLFFGAGEKVVRVFVSPVVVDRYFFSQFGCIIVIFILNVSSIASLFLVTLVTAERYYAISRPVKHRLMAGKPRTLKFITTAWIISVLISITIVPSHSVFSTYCFVWPDDDLYVNFPPIIGVCDNIQPWWTDYANGMQTIPFFVALFLNFYMYFAIIVSLYNHVDPSSSVSASATRMRLVVSWMVIFNGVVFFCCNALFNLISAMFMVSSLAGNTTVAMQWYHAVSPFHVLLLYINSMVNPFIYGATNKRLRKAFIASMGCAGQGITSSDDSTHHHTFSMTLKN
ncbi:somatostatin receptor type 2-like [Apostichopus japonicus]|uniref:somatostatin receptor type 2-like n=1 Tax=Stichopus japonicus TaxID=307972 RepID=UPI003AB398AF